MVLTCRRFLFGLTTLGGYPQNLFIFYIFIYARFTRYTVARRGFEQIGYIKTIKFGWLIDWWCFTLFVSAYVSQATGVCAHQWVRWQTFVDRAFDWLELLQRSNKCVHMWLIIYRLMRRRILFVRCLFCCWRFKFGCAPPSTIFFFFFMNKQTNHLVWLAFRQDFFDYKC